jgi:hypothetical protein
MNILECVDNLIQEEAEEHRGVFGKVQKYASDIGAGALAHLSNKAIGQNSAGDGYLAGAGIHAAHKMYDLGSNNYQSKNKTVSGSIAGAALGHGVGHLALQALHKYNDNVRQGANYL